MLRGIERGLAVLALGTGLFVALPVMPSWAAECPPGQVWNETQGRCVEVVVTDPGDPGDDDDGDNPPPGGGPAQCVTKEYGGRPPFEVPCYDANHGYWSNADSCYWQESRPPPPGTDPVWEGHYPEGSVYEPYCLPRINLHQNNCRDIGGTNDECLEWRARPPWEVITPEELARRAVQSMQLTGPDIGMAPPPGSDGVIGMPVWLWNNVNDHTWTSTSDPACDQGLCVTVTATATKITWSMGDGGQEVCDEGTPYAAQASATCSHTYQHASKNQQDGKYQITATTAWTVTWQASNGLSGELDPFDLTSEAGIGVVELESVITD